MKRALSPPCVWGLVASWWAFGRWLNPKGSDLINPWINPSVNLTVLLGGDASIRIDVCLEEVSHGVRGAFEGCISSPVPSSFSFCILAAMRGATLLHHVVPAMKFCLTTAQKQWSQPTDHGLK
jgi:hypothetical protein